MKIEIDNRETSMRCVHQLGEVYRPVISSNLFLVVMNYDGTYNFLNLKTNRVLSFDYPTLAEMDVEHSLDVHVPLKLVTDRPS